jgi:hypothetical protein
MKLLITGGALRPNGFELGEGKYYGCAKLLKLDLETGDVHTLLSIDEGNDNCPDVDPNLEFTVGDIEAEALWLATDTEIRRYRYPSLELVSTYSYPFFHNIHSVAVRGSELYVTSTGLDMVVVLNKSDGKVVRLINAEGRPVWHRFSPEIDYRKIHSTRPHDCHPNYVFWIEGEPWVTRCTQEDAVSLDDFSKRIDVSGSRRPISVHDGIIDRGRILFTTVDGAIVIANPRTLALEEVVELHSMKGFAGVRGWCRGLYVAGDILYVAFSRLRKTRKLEKIQWVGRLLRKGDVHDSASVLAIDLAKKRIVRDYRIPAGMIDAIYSLLPEPL